MKFVFSIFLTFLLLSCTSSTQQSGLRPIDLIPSSSILIFQSEDLASTSSILLKNSFFEENQDLPIFKQVSNQVEFFNQFATASNGVFCFSAVGKKDIASTFIASSEDVNFQQLKGEISNHKSFNYEGKQVHEFSWRDKNLYAVWFEENILVSNSKLIVENKIRDLTNSIPINQAFTDVLKTVNSSTPSLFLDLNQFKNIYNKGFAEHTYSLFSNLTDWVALDLKIEQNKLQLNGVGISKESDKRKLGLLKNQNRIQHTIAKLVPLNAIGFESYAITDFEAYLNQRKAFGLSNKTKFLNLFESIEEVSKIHFAKEDLVVLRSRKAAITFEDLNPLMESHKTFRSFEIFQLDESDLLQVYAPLIVLKQANFVTQIEDFFVFSSSVEALENTIINHVNRLSLQEQASYQTQLAKLSSKSTALLYALSENWADYMQDNSHSSFKENLKALSFLDYKGLALQVNVDSENAYFNAILQESKQDAKVSAVKQKGRYKLSSPPLTQPHFFTNWRTKQRDVFVQDHNLQLQLLDADAKPLWSRKLSEVILGNAIEFDIYRNTRLQLAFATQNYIYVLDKNGKDVAPFPIKLKEKITQPLQIFDYDNNGKHRFIICQANKMKAFNKDGKQVKGFAFTSDNSDISQPPKHFRIGRKDYLLVQEASGKLHILDRTGKERVSYQTEVEFSGNPWFVYDGKFTSTTKDGNLVQITEGGKVEITEKDLLPTHFITANNRLLVTLSENILQINEVQIELDYGLYTAPQIIESQDKTWVSVTDTQAKKLYVFDEFGNELKGFPVYGNSAVDYFSTEASKTQLMLMGEEDSVLFYEIN